MEFLFSKDVLPFENCDEERFSLSSNMSLKEFKRASFCEKSGAFCLVVTSLLLKGVAFLGDKSSPVAELVKVLEDTKEGKRENFSTIRLQKN